MIKRIINSVTWQESLVVVFFIGISLVYFWPMVKAPATSSMSDYDGLFVAWVHATVANKIYTLDANLFDGNIFHPYENTLAYSDLYLTNSLMALPLWILTHEPLVLTTFNLLVAQAMLLIFTYFLIHELTNERWGALIFSLVFSFSPLRLHYLGYMHTFSMAMLPLAMLAMVKLTKRRSVGWLLVIWLAFMLQMANSLLLAVMMGIAFAIFLGLMPKLRANMRQLSWWILGLGLLGVVLQIPIVRPYLQVSNEFNYVRPITDVIHFSMSPEEIVTTFGSPLLLLGVVIAVIWIIFRKRITRMQLTFLVIGLVGFVLALGPALHWMGVTIKIPYHIPLPYAVLYYLVPGLKGFRAPSRWIVLSGFSLTVFAAMIVVTMKQFWKRMVMGLLVVGFIVTFPKLNPTAVPAVADYPDEYYWLKDQPGDVVIELPMFRWGYGDFEKNEVYRMLYSTYHEKDLVNGYSGFSPPEWETLVAELIREFPSESSWQWIVESDVDYVLIHLDEYERFLGDEYVDFEHSLRDRLGAFETIRINDTVIVRL